MSQHASLVLVQVYGWCYFSFPFLDAAFPLTSCWRLALFGLGARGRFRCSSVPFSSILGIFGRCSNCPQCYAVCARLWLAVLAEPVEHVIILFGDVQTCPPIIVPTFAVYKYSLSHRPVGELTNTGVGEMRLNRARPIQFHRPLGGPQKGRLPLLVRWCLGPAPRRLATDVCQTNQDYSRVGAACVPLT